MIVSTPQGDRETEGREMRPVEQEIVKDILDRLDFVDRREGGFDYFKLGTRNEILGRLKELRELDLEKADNEAFRKIEKFVVPKELKIQGVYSDNERSKGPDLFIPITIGMELKGLRGEVESIGLRIEDPYEAEEFAINLQKELGDDWMVRSWMRTHAERFQLVKTEKIMMSFALSFITLLSAFSAETAGNWSHESARSASFSDSQGFCLSGSYCRNWGGYFWIGIGIVSDSLPRRNYGDYSRVWH
jgi:hypothetical protein